ncbi:MAG: hypothetical protein R3C26_10365 [Calditrichia bacterium]
MLQPDSFAVICSDTVLFTSVYPSGRQLSREHRFWAGGLLRRNAANGIVDSLTYDDNAPYLQNQRNGNEAHYPLKKSQS